MAIGLEPKNGDRGLMSNLPYPAVSPVLWLVLLMFSEINADQQSLRVGVTLHPYYSWTLNVVGDRAEVIPLIPADVDPHSYQPQPKDVQRLIDLDAVVLNGMGHDSFLGSMLKVSGNQEIYKVDLHRNVPLLRQPGAISGEEILVFNSHTFLSITSAVHQLNNLRDALIHLDPVNADWYRENTRRYKSRLRKHLSTALKELAGIDHQKSHSLVSSFCWPCSTASCCSAPALRWPRREG
jgi:zinc transport system substrate-binding protein